MDLKPLFDGAVEEVQLRIRLAGHVPLEVGLERALDAQYATIDHLDGYAQYLVPEGDAGTAPAGFMSMRLFSGAARLKRRPSRSSPMRVGCLEPS